MIATRGEFVTIVRIFLALLVALVTGFWGLVTLFSDFAPRWSYGSWALYVVAGHVLAGFFIGSLVPSRWWLSVGAAWGAVFIGVIGLLSILRPGNMGPAPPVSFPSRIVFPALALLVLPAIVAVAGYAGSRIAGRWSRTVTATSGIDQAPRTP